MTMTLAMWLVHGATLYLAVGVLFALAFICRGAGRIDPVARQGTWGFRLMILPGSAALWPLLAWRWLRGTGEPPTERNPHRDAAGGEP